MTDEIHVRLLGEGINVWRPIQADQIGNGIYRISHMPRPEDLDESWEFAPGSIVVCERQETGQGVIQVAVSLRS
ncbi:MAG TPA: hypothetical protein VFC78_20830 [Tepidisphaeraceae bacterium]|nr:hypothetical protein [Tepidisphaeraceae bacterium]